MIIAIDHGNSEIKTAHEAFPSGLVGNPAMPQMAADWMEFGGNTYALSGSHLPYQRDKTANDDFYILSLFAIAKELARCEVQQTDVQLAIGLPPAHMQGLKESFARYFVRDQKEIAFHCNGVDYKITITAANVFPQAYPAVYERYEQIAALDKAYIVDVGGYTADVLLLRHGKLDLGCCYSLECGVIKLFTKAASVLTSRFGGTVEESDIRNALMGKETLLDASMRETVRQVAQAHCDALLADLQANDVDLSFAHAFFVGGGALLLRPMLEQSGRLKHAEFVTDTLANAKGYEAMAKAAAGVKQGVKKGAEK
ncbi:hypothetical protein [Ethanoligenens sp.]|uniref:ParM/StbA family protein n=1 Tax=Ethanoligenens sp. TaxID=2099655 RepID=UPI0039E95B4B